MNAKHIFLLALCGTLASTAHAQWQWLDDGGRKVFSDRPPPPSIPSQNVLLKPAGAGVVQTVPSVAASNATSTEANAAADGSNAEKSTKEAVTDRSKRAGIDPELEEKKATLDAEEERKKQEQEKKVAVQRKENCDRAKHARNTMQSGQMISHTNAKGERGFMSEVTRQQELSRFNQTIASDCS